MHEEAAAAADADPSVVGYVVAHDHWAEPGGQTVEALKRMLALRLGYAVPVLTLEIVSTVEELRQAVFGPLF